MKPKGKASAILILAAIFACGALCGVGGSFYYLKKQRQQFAQRAQWDMMYRAQANRVLDRLTRMLELTDEQQAAIKEEIDPFTEEMKQLHRDMRLQARELMGQRSKAIQSHLTPEQLEKFKEMRHKHRDREKMRRDGKPKESAFSQGCFDSADT